MSQSQYLGKERQGGEGSPTEVDGRDVSEGGKLAEHSSMVSEGKREPIMNSGTIQAREREGQKDEVQGQPQARA